MAAPPPLQVASLAVESNCSVAVGGWYVCESREADNVEVAGR